jgi:prolyl-tRNA synthetase
MKLSNYFIPTLKESPADAKILSHQLMIRSGMVRQVNSGIYSWLPLGHKVLTKITNIIKKELDRAGCLQITMPTIQPASLWKESGRYDNYGKEMLRMKDRHNHEMLYGPTHEEVVTDIFRQNIHSYKDLPKNLYQIHWKFRDEIRPRFGVMRAREFFMKDGYSFDINFESAQKTYDKMYEAYFNIFHKMGLKVIAVRADNGSIGGDLSHEFHILSQVGESKIFYDKNFDEIIRKSGFNAKKLQEIYSASEEKHDLNNSPLSSDEISSSRGIEVGHIFYFDDKYSKTMNAKLLDSNGKEFYPKMSSYGIGVSRVVAGIIEASHDKSGIIWPKEVAPFDFGLVNLKVEDNECKNTSDKIYNFLQDNGFDVLYDDTKASIGEKLGKMDLIGLPQIITIGPKILKEGKIEIKDRKAGERKLLDLENIDSLKSFCFS